MSASINKDLGRVLAGSLSREDFRDLYGEHEFEGTLSLHDRLSELATVEVEIAPWYAVAPGLGADPGPKHRRRYKAALVSVAAALVLVPAAAEGLEAVAPNAVRGTIIDTITDVLPWDNDRRPVNDRAPRVTDVPEDDGGPADQRGSLDRRRPGDVDAGQVRPRDQADRVITDESRRRPSHRDTDSTDLIDRRRDRVVEQRDREAERRDRPRDEVRPNDESPGIRDRHPDRTDFTPTTLLRDRFDPTDGHVVPTDRHAGPTSGHLDPSDGQVEPTEGRVDPTDSSGVGEHRGPVDGAAGAGTASTTTTTQGFTADAGRPDSGARSDSGD